LFSARNFANKIARFGGGPRLDATRRRGRFRSASHGYRRAKIGARAAPAFSAPLLGKAVGAGSTDDGVESRNHRKGEKTRQAGSEGQHEKRAPDHWPALKFTREGFSAALNIQLKPPVLREAICYLLRHATRISQGVAVEIV
jgi:hypothetical protein